MMDEICNHSDEEINIIGLDFNQSVVEKAKATHPGMEFHTRDIFQDKLDEFNNSTDIAICVNTLHEVFSFYGANGHFDPAKGKNAVHTVLSKIHKILKPNGVITLFDGVETPIRPYDTVNVEFPTKKIEKDFLRMCEEYTPFKLEYEKLDERLYRLNSISFTRFITKYRFFENIVWELEKDESYQYYSVEEFIKVFHEIGFEIEVINLLSPNIGTWSNQLKIKTPGVQYPHEHILIIGRKI
jgi:SAM-dependent methyltransferase